MQESFVKMVVRAVLYELQYQFALILHEVAKATATTVSEVVKAIMH